MSMLVVNALLMGAAATACIDLWALFVRRALGQPTLDYCLLGRWVLHMPQGRFAHESIARADSRRHECALGWLAHYSIGIGFAVVFLLLMGDGWRAHPTPAPALLYGVATVVVPFFTMQPAFGLGIAASRTPHPGMARLRSLATHAVFGAGLYLGALLLSR